MGQKLGHKENLPDIICCSCYANKPFPHSAAGHRESQTTVPGGSEEFHVRDVGNGQSYETQLFLGLLPVSKLLQLWLGGARLHRPLLQGSEEAE